MFSVFVILLNTPILLIETDHMIRLSCAVKFMSSQLLQNGGLHSHTWDSVSKGGQKDWSPKAFPHSLFYSGSGGLMVKALVRD